MPGPTGVTVRKASGKRGEKTKHDSFSFVKRQLNKRIHLKKHMVK
jgi:hypothetical protein